MAAEGIRFERFYAGAPVCSPTRGSAITGRHPFRYGIVNANKGKMEAEEITLAEVLKEEGYTTGHFGKWHMGTLTTTMKDSNRGDVGKTEHYSPPWENGFDACCSTEAKVPTWDPIYMPTVFEEGESKKTGWEHLKPSEATKPFGTHYWTGPEAQVTENLSGDDSRVIMDRALPFIEGAVAEDKPFFAVIWFHAPHLPVVAGPDHAEMYKEFPLHTRNFYGCISAVDDQMGRLRQTLKDLEVDQQTMLWFCSDNGPEGGSHYPGTTNQLRGRKRSLYEGGVRVPGLVVWPEKIKASRKVAMPCTTNPKTSVLFGAGMSCGWRFCEGGNSVGRAGGRLG